LDNKNLQEAAEKIIQEINFGISIDNLSAIDIGKPVVFISDYSGIKEKGIISSWNKRFVFVTYGKEKVSKATNPKSLFYDNNYFTNDFDYGDPF
jgi:hypothetical protein